MQNSFGPRVLADPETSPHSCWWSSRGAEDFDALSDLSGVRDFGCLVGRFCALSSGSRPFWSSVHNKVKAGTIKSAARMATTSMAVIVPAGAAACDTVRVSGRSLDLAAAQRADSRLSPAMVRKDA